LISEQGWEAYFRSTPYAEWYPNAIQIKGSPAAQYHKKKYGDAFAYEDFAPQFQKHVEKWDPDRWASFLNEAGAKYVVYVTKFHDGFLMWPSAHKCPARKGWHSERDTVGELADAVRARGIRMGVYYSGALDWVFTQKPVMDLVDLMTGGPQTEHYAEYVDHHYMELIEKIRPDILWNDIGYPPKGRREQVIACYYNTVKDGCINDRWVQYGRHMRYTRKQPLRRLINHLGARAMKAGRTGAPSSIHVDFTTPEFTHPKRIQKKKFEAILGFGTSVAYNALEKDSECHSVEQMAKWFCDIIANNGNLLLVASPKADGCFPEVQTKRILEFGRWVKKNAEAIYGSRPFLPDAEALQNDENGPRFTVKAGSLYAFVPQSAGSALKIQGLSAQENTEVHLLGWNGKVEWASGKNNLTIRLPPGLEESPVHVCKITPVPKRK
jgi:alpha-L-fucosidase